MNMIQNAKTQVLELTLQAYNKAADAGLLPAGCPVQPSVEIPKDTANGDYTTTFCLAAAKALKKNPRQVAQILMDHMALSGSYFTSVEMAGPGFLNFRLGNKWFRDTVACVQAKPRSASSCISCSCVSTAVSSMICSTAVCRSFFMLSCLRSHF